MRAPRPERSLLPPVSDTALVRISHCDFGYSTARRVLHDVTLEVPRGKVVALMGGSGCGKTTLLRLIGGQERAQGGQVVVDGADMAGLDADALYRMRRRMGQYECRALVDGSEVASAEILCAERDA